MYIVWRKTAELWYWLDLISPSKKDVSAGPCRIAPALLSGNRCRAHYEFFFWSFVVRILPCLIQREMVQREMIEREMVQREMIEIQMIERGSSDRY